MNSQSPSGSSATLPLVASEDSTLSAVGSQTIVEEDESDLLEDEIKSRLIAKILELEEKTSGRGVELPSLSFSPGCTARTRVASRFWDICAALPRFLSPLSSRILSV